MSMVPWGMNKSSFLSITEVHGSHSWGGGHVSMQDTPWRGQPPKKRKESSYKYCWNKLPRGAEQVKEFGWLPKPELSAHWMPWRKDGERMWEREREEEGSRSGHGPYTSNPHHISYNMFLRFSKECCWRNWIWTIYFCINIKCLGHDNGMEENSLFLGAHAEVFKDEVSCICNFQGVQ